MSEASPAGAVSARPRGLHRRQILATWRALLVNPDLDPVHALHAIDRLLGQHAGPAADQTAFASPLNLPRQPGPAQHSVIAEVLAILPYGLARYRCGAGGQAHR